MNNCNPICLALALALALAGPVSAHNGVIHEAPHGGIMRPVNNNHLEIVLAPKGGVRIYVYNLKNAPMPASAISELSVEIDRPGQKTEYVTMKRDPTGTVWIGGNRPVMEPTSVVRIGSVIGGTSGLIEVQRSKFPAYAKVAKK
jgi:hypothetical protein